MSFSQQIAKHFRAVFFGGNWTDVNLKDTLENVNWQQAITRIQNRNSIAALVFHINYYVNPILKVLQGETLNASDKFSFDLPAITSEADWQKLVSKTLEEADLLAAQIEKLEDAKLFEDFADPKYGSNYKNLHGLIEHTHYHLGQIVLLKKMMQEK